MAMKEEKEQLKWYIVNPNTITAQAWDYINDINNWATAIILPLCFVWDDFFKMMTLFFWISDGFWVAMIASKFITADNQNRTFLKITKRYLASGDFVIDCLHTLPSIIVKEKNIVMFYSKFLRLRYFHSMFSIFDKFLQFYFSTYSEH